MNRKVGLVAGVATLGVAIYFGTRLWAQAPAAPAQAPAQMRVALVNIVHLIKSYHKAKTFNDEMARLAAPFEKSDKELRVNLEAWQKEAQKQGIAPEQRDKAEKEIRERKRQIDDNLLEAKKVIEKRQGDGMVQLYHEVEDAVKRYAASNGFHLVMAHHEANASEAYHPANIQRKLQGTMGTGCAFPVYAAPGLDITQAVLANLNAGAQAAAPAAGTPAAAAPAPAQR